MPTVTITDENGQLTVTVDGGEPQPVQNAEDACQVVEATFGQPDGDDTMAPEELNTEGMEGDQFEAGFGNVRGAGLNG